MKENEETQNSENQETALTKENQTQQIVPVSNALVDLGSVDDDRDPIVSHLEEEGMTDRQEARLYVELTEAQRPIVLTDKKTLEDGTKIETQRIKFVEDNVIKLAALKTISQIKGRFRETKKKAGVQNIIGKIFVIGGKPAQNPPPTFVDISPAMEELGTEKVSSNTPPPSNVSARPLTWTP